MHRLLATSLSYVMVRLSSSKTQTAAIWLQVAAVVREAMSGSSLLRLSAPRFRIELQAMRLRERGGALGVEMELLLAQLFYDATLPKGSGGA